MIDYTQLIVALISVLTGGVAVTLVNHFFTRKKTGAETRKADSEATRNFAEARQIETETRKLQATLELENDSINVKADLPFGWFLAGSRIEHYEIQIDRENFHSGTGSGHLKALADSRGFGTLMQLFNAEDYRNTRMRYSAYVRSKGVVRWAGMWMRVDASEIQSKKTLSFDNMQERPIRGTNDWQKYSIVLDIPEESGSISFGVLLAGGGEIWIDDIVLEEVSKEVELTSSEMKLGPPQNLNFEICEVRPRLTPIQFAEEN